MWFVCSCAGTRDGTASWRGSDDSLLCEYPRKATKGAVCVYVPGETARIQQMRYFLRYL